MKPELERYAGLVRQIRGKAKEHRALLTKKKESPALNVLHHRDLPRRISELIEESVKKDVFSMEDSLMKLDTQEERYAAALDGALREYAGLMEQAVEMYADELMTEQLALHPDKEQTAISRIKAAYGEKYVPQMMSDSRPDIAKLLDKEQVEKSIQERLNEKQ